MNSFKKYSLLFVTMLLMVWSKTNAQTAVSFQVFYDDLSPYGQWVLYPEYGYAWIPEVDADFIPYSSRGYWIWTEFGWTWVSDYRWGWAPFHYGRWLYDDFYGWVWVPGNEWGPAWVAWRRSPGYYGWTPMGPGIHVNVILNGSYNPPHHHWIFVNDHYMGRRDIYHYYGPRKNSQQLINNSTVINNTYVDKKRNTTYIKGPEREEVQKITGNEIKQTRIRESSKPEQNVKNDELNIYRPAITKSDVHSKPARITDKKDVKPISERKPARENLEKSTGEPERENIPEKKKQTAEPREPEKKRPEENNDRQEKITPREQKDDVVPKKIENRDVTTPTNEKRVLPDNTRTKQPQPKVNPPVKPSEPVVPKTNQREQPNKQRPRQGSNAPRQQPRKKPGSSN